jgi:hypothetical protein
MGPKLETAPIARASNDTQQANQTQDQNAIKAQTEQLQTTTFTSSLNFHPKNQIEVKAENIENVRIFGQDLLDQLSAQNAMMSGILKSLSLGTASQTDLSAMRAVLELYESQKKKTERERAYFSPTERIILQRVLNTNQYTEADKQLLDKMQQCVPGLTPDTALKLMSEINKIVEGTQATVMLSDRTEQLTNNIEGALKDLLSKDRVSFNDESVKQLTLNLVNALSIDLTNITVQQAISSVLLMVSASQHITADNFDQISRYLYDALTANTQLNYPRQNLAQLITESYREATTAGKLDLQLIANNLVISQIAEQDRENILAVLQALNKAENGNLDLAELPELTSETRTLKCASLDGLKDLVERSVYLQMALEHTGKRHELNYISTHILDDIREDNKALLTQDPEIIDRTVQATLANINELRDEVLTQQKQELKTSLDALATEITKQTQTGQNQVDYDEAISNHLNKFLESHAILEIDIAQRKEEYINELTLDLKENVSNQKALQSHESELVTNQLKDELEEQIKSKAKEIAVTLHFEPEQTFNPKEEAEKYLQELLVKASLLENEKDKQEREIFLNAIINNEAYKSALTNELQKEVAKQQKEIGRTLRLEISEAIKPALQNKLQLDQIRQSFAESYNIASESALNRFNNAFNIEVLKLTLPSEQSLNSSLSNLDAKAIKALADATNFVTNTQNNPIEKTTFYGLVTELEKQKVITNDTSTRILMVLDRRTLNQEIVEIVKASNINQQLVADLILGKYGDLSLLEDSTKQSLESIIAKSLPETLLKQDLHRSLRLAMSGQIVEARKLVQYTFNNYYESNLTVNQSFMQLPTDARQILFSAIKDEFESRTEKKFTMVLDKMAQSKSLLKVTSEDVKELLEQNIESVSSIREYNQLIEDAVILARQNNDIDALVKLFELEDLIGKKHLEMLIAKLNDDDKSVILRTLSIKIVHDKNFYKALHSLGLTEDSKKSSYDILRFNKIVEQVASSSPNAMNELCENIKLYLIAENNKALNRLTGEPENTERRIAIETELAILKKLSMRDKPADILAAVIYQRHVRDNTILKTHSFAELKKQLKGEATNENILMKVLSNELSKLAHNAGRLDGYNQSLLREDEKTKKDQIHSRECYIRALRRCESFVNTDLVQEYYDQSYLDGTLKGIGKNFERLGFESLITNNQRYSNESYIGSSGSGSNLLTKEKKDEINKNAKEQLYNQLNRIESTAEQYLDDNLLNTLKQKIKDYKDSYDAGENLSYLAGVKHYKDCEGVAKELFNEFNDKKSVIAILAKYQAISQDVDKVYEQLTVNRVLKGTVHKVLLEQHTDVWMGNLRNVYDRVHDTHLDEDAKEWRNILNGSGHKYHHDAYMLHQAIKQNDINVVTSILKPKDSESQEEWLLRVEETQALFVNEYGSSYQRSNFMDIMRNQFTFSGNMFYEAKDKGFDLYLNTVAFGNKEGFEAAEIKNLIDTGGIVLDREIIRLYKEASDGAKKKVCAYYKVDGLKQLLEKTQHDSYGIDLKLAERIDQGYWEDCDRIQFYLTTKQEHKYKAELTEISNQPKRRDELLKNFEKHYSNSYRFVFQSTTLANIAESYMQDGRIDTVVALRGEAKTAEKIFENARTYDEYENSWPFISAVRGLFLTSDNLVEEKGKVAEAKYIEYQKAKNNKASPTELAKVEKEFLEASILYLDSTQQLREGRHIVNGVAFEVTKVATGVVVSMAIPGSGVIVTMLVAGGTTAILEIASDDEITQDDLHRITVSSLISAGTAGAVKGAANMLAKPTSAASGLGDDAIKIPPKPVGNGNTTQPLTGSADKVDDVASSVRPKTTRLSEDGGDVVKTSKGNEYRRVKEEVNKVKGGDKDGQWVTKAEADKAGLVIDKNKIDSRISYVKVDKTNSSGSTASLDDMKPTQPLNPAPSKPAVPFDEINRLPGIDISKPTGVGLGKVISDTSKNGDESSSEVEGRNTSPSNQNPTNEELARLKLEDSNNVSENSRPKDVVEPSSEVNASASNQNTKNEEQPRLDIEDNKTVLDSSRPKNVVEPSSEVEGRNTSPDNQSPKNGGEPPPDEETSLASSDDQSPKNGPSNSPDDDDDDFGVGSTGTERSARSKESSRSIDSAEDLDIPKLVVIMPQQKASALDSNTNTNREDPEIIAPRLGLKIAEDGFNTYTLAEQRERAEKLQSELAGAANAKARESVNITSEKIGVSYNDALSQALVFANSNSNENLNTLVNNNVNLQSNANQHASANTNSNLNSHVLANKNKQSNKIRNANHSANQNANQIANSAKNVNVISNSNSDSQKTANSNKQDYQMAQGVKVATATEQAQGNSYTAVVKNADRQFDQNNIKQATLSEATKMASVVETGQTFKALSSKEEDKVTNTPSLETTKQSQNGIYVSTAQKEQDPVRATPAQIAENGWTSKNSKSLRKNDEYVVTSLAKVANPKKQEVEVTSNKLSNSVENKNELKATQSEKRQSNLIKEIEIDKNNTKQKVKIDHLKELVSQSLDELELDLLVEEQEMLILTTEIEEDSSSGSANKKKKAKKKAIDDKKAQLAKLRMLFMNYMQEIISAKDRREYILSLIEELGLEIDPELLNLIDIDAILEAEGAIEQEEQVESLMVESEEKVDVIES